MLTVREHMTLQVASRRYRYPGVRTAETLEVLGYTETRYAQVLTALLERPDAEAAYPQLIHRLRRLRDVRRAARRGRVA